MPKTKKVKRLDVPGVEPLDMTDEEYKAKILQNRSVTNYSKVKKQDNEASVYRCVRCGYSTAAERVKNFFFKGGTKSSMFVYNDGFVPFCKNCCNEMFERHKRTYESVKVALAVMCSLLDWYYSEDLYRKLISRIQPENLSLADYNQQVKLQQYGTKNFSDNIAQFLTALSDSTNQSQEDKDLIEAEEWTDEDRLARNTAISIIGYDPFEDYPISDRKYLFNELVKYFDDDIADDTYKLSQIIQIVNNNNQIRKYDALITKLQPIQDGKEIADLNSIKATLVTANDKIAKENEISVKNRTNKEIGKSTLTYLQRYLRQLDFDKAEADYYNQLRSEGTRWALDMSLEAIRNNAYFNENDIEEIKEMRREIITGLEKDIDDLTEDKRLLIKYIRSLENRLKDIGEWIEPIDVTNLHSEREKIQAQENDEETRDSAEVEGELDESKQ